MHEQKSFLIFLAVIILGMAGVSWLVIVINNYTDRCTQWRKELARRVPGVTLVRTQDACLAILPGGQVLVFPEFPTPKESHEAKIFKKG